MKIAAGHYLVRSIGGRTAAIILAVTLAIVSTGCNHRIKEPAAIQTHVGYASTAPPGTQRYTLNDDENATAPTKIEDPAPVYPPDALAMRLPKVTVSVKAIVDVEGKVTEARIAHAATPKYPAAFDDAVRAAVMQWRYQPLYIRTFEDVLDAQGNVADSRLVSQIAQPFSLDYDFYFELRDGKPIVDSAPAARKSTQ